MSDTDNPKTDADGVAVDAEKKVEILLKNAEGKLEAKPFGEEEGSETQEAKEKPSVPEEPETDDDGMLF